MIHWIHCNTLRPVLEALYSFSPCLSVVSDVQWSFLWVLDVYGWSCVLLVINTDWPNCFIMHAVKHRHNLYLNWNTTCPHGCGKLTWMFWMLSSSTSLAAVRVKWTYIPDSVANTSSSGTLLTRETPRPSSKFSNTCKWIRRGWVVSHRISHTINK